MKKPPEPTPENASEAAQPARPMVKVQKRTADAPVADREKLCAECGRAFSLETDQKFYLCPSCYRRRFARKGTKRGEAQVLIQIQCVGCGATDYLDFMPADPAKAYCKACFAQRRREPADPSEHTS